MGFWIQYKALMFKNWVLWKRKLLGSLCELLLPIFVILVLGFLRLAIPPEQKDKQSYKDQVSDSYKISRDTVYGKSIPFSKCIYNGGKESLGYSIISDDEDFISYMVQGIDTLTFNRMASDKFKSVRKMNPEKRNYHSSAMPMTEASIDAGFLRDVYVSLGEPIDRDPPEGEWAGRVYYKPFVDWIWGGCILMALGGIAAMLDRRYRVKARHGDKNSANLPAG